MSAPTWTRRKADAARRLMTACPSLRQHPSERNALATIAALADIELAIHLREGRIEPDLRAEPAILADKLARELLELVARHATDRASSFRPARDAAFGDWLEEHGFSRMSVALAGDAAARRELQTIAEIVAASVRTLCERSKALALAHMQGVLDRDLPGVPFDRLGLTQAAAWLLAPETSGRPDRANVLERRRQALSIYGALSSTLFESEITIAIDRGAPLAPLLEARHDLKPGELRALREARRLRRSVEASTDFHVAVEELKAHEVLLHEWPGHGMPAQPAAWEASVWHRTARQNFVRPDYLGDQPSEVQDAIDALRDDLLRPLVAERMRIGGVRPDWRIKPFARSVELGSAKGGGEPRRRLIAVLRRAIVASRKPMAFREAIGRWHRRAASLAALRHERRVDRPGWPPLCAPWTSSCGRFEMVALASAADLVEEGRILDHCVGGYYDTCRRDDTQILSLREHGRQVATVELKLGAGVVPVPLEVGQFKARSNCPAPAHLHDLLREFLRAVRGGAHPVESKHIDRYRKRMRETWDEAWRGDALTLEHAREVFPFYLALLPRGTPASFDAWCEASGLPSALDTALAHLAAGPGKQVDNHVPH